MNIFPQARSITVWTLLQMIRRRENNMIVLNGACCFTIATETSSIVVDKTITDACVEHGNGNRKRYDDGRSRSGNTRNEGCFKSEMLHVTSLIRTNFRECFKRKRLIGIFLGT